jgi:hypothetical protein
MTTARKTIEVIALLSSFSGAVPAAEIQAVSGAVGLEDRQRMLQSYGDYNLHLAFAQADGAYLADVGLSIRSADGQIVWSGFSEGPFFFAQVPGGQYQVNAEFDGRVVSKIVQVRSAAPGPMHHFFWKVQLN